MGMIFPRLTEKKRPGQVAVDQGLRGRGEVTLSVKNMRESRKGTKIHFREREGGKRGSGLVPRKADRSTL